MKHTWETETFREGGPEHIDRFAYEAGYHNGPRCTVCGFYFCVHSNPEAENSQCGTAPIPGDPAKLSPGVDAVRTTLGLEPIAGDF